MMNTILPEQYFFLIDIDPEGIHGSNHCVYTNVKLPVRVVVCMCVCVWGGGGGGERGWGDSYSVHVGSEIP